MVAYVIQLVYVHKLYIFICKWRKHTSPICTILSPTKKINCDGELSHLKLNFVVSKRNIENEQDKNGLNISERTHQNNNNNNNFVNFDIEFRELIPYSVLYNTYVCCRARKEQKKGFSGFRCRHRFNILLLSKHTNTQTPSYLPLAFLNSLKYIEILFYFFRYPKS